MLWDISISKRGCRIFFLMRQPLYELDIILDKKYRKCIDKLNEGLRVYYGMLERAFSPNYSEALDGSVALAMSFGVPSGELLKTISEVDKYFMG